MNWINEGEQMANKFLDQCALNDDCADEVEEPECPWPIYTPEGADWLKGWNSVVRDQDSISDMIFMRPDGAGWMFEPALA